MGSGEHPSQIGSLGRDTKVQTWAQNPRELEIKEARAAEGRERLKKELARQEQERQEKEKRRAAERAAAFPGGQKRTRIIDWLKQLNELDRLKWLPVQSSILL